MKQAAKFSWPPCGGEKTRAQTRAEARAQARNSEITAGMVRGVVVVVWGCQVSRATKHNNSPLLLCSHSKSQARLWTCGRGDVSTPCFGSHLNPISTRGVILCPPYTNVHTKFPQARLEPYIRRKVTVHKRTSKSG